MFVSRNWARREYNNIIVPNFRMKCDVSHLFFQTERQFEQTLKASRGLMIKKMRPDGACLFRAVGELVH